MSNIPGVFANPTQCRCYAAMESSGKIVPHVITRRSCGPADIVIDIKFAGICHSDIHMVRNEWMEGEFPLVPGHEIGGLVTAIGEQVKNFAVGDVVGVGCIVDSCRVCSECMNGNEQYCLNGLVGTYGGKFKYPHCAEYNTEGGNRTNGGYSKTIVVDRSYVCKIPTNLDLAAATPLLCAGITTYSPMKHFGLQSGHRFAVNGLGGLGHMGAKFGKAFGCHTTVISRGSRKKESALTGLGADAFLDSTDAEAMKAATGTFDFILDTVSAEHSMDALLSLLKVDGKVVLVGAPPKGFQVSHPFNVIARRLTVAASMIGGMRETQEMLDFCGQHGITCDVEVVKPTEIDECYNRAVAGDVKYRFVIDTADI